MPIYSRNLTHFYFQEVLFAARIVYSSRAAPSLHLYPLISSSQISQEAVELLD